MGLGSSCTSRSAGCDAVIAGRAAGLGFRRVDRVIVTHVPQVWPRCISLHTSLIFFSIDFI